MKKYWKILKKYRASLWLSPFLVFIGVVGETIQPYFMARIVDDGVMQNDLSVITRTGILMIAVSILGLTASVINIYVSSRTSIGFGTDLRSSLFRKIQQLAFPDIDYFSSASLITRLTNDVTRIQQVIMMSMRIMLRAPMMLVMAIFFIIHINTDLALILTASVPLLAISVYLILRKGFPFFLIVQQKIDALNGVVRENLINIRVVKSFVREDFETEKFVRNSEDLRDMVIKASNIIVAMFPMMQLIMNLSILAILWFGGVKVMSGQLLVGELISFVNYLMQVLMGLMMLSMVIMTYARASASSKRIVEVLDKEPSLSDTPEGQQGHHAIREGRVSFRNVSFRYTGGETDVLRQIDFDVQPGETIAVVGMTGSGKSSMLQLIPRLYDVTGGQVLIDGRNVKDYALDELHHKVGVVLQKNELFTGTIGENLRWGNANATAEEVEEAARAAEAHDFIASFPDGYDTVLGRGGVNISGGQKQRLCIARALLRKPKVLILDDSTSAVDSETELKIRSNLNRLLKDTTLFIITQRIHTMQSADRVIVLEDGEIDAIGRPEELMLSSTIYQEIYNSQRNT
ncbi:ABC transporter ATP-binding protein [Parabacteroides sp. PF5-6]|uniref:ABC transporter ATP-binding protein n=1 Tax=Parabacteroides sp. PF5-6 TaxID=1742403 RepID=UPI0024069C32|nr:ABC transporter ATP-binding protein [Parabacteroides sp. PF5-6]MDF9830365.1 ATP-binding cassette subfamily B multidrug efflux pump [Parabacteroides sp. PF5-6]